MKNIIFLAPPAAGKGTQSSLLQEKYGYAHLSTGDMLREAIASDSQIGRSVKSIIEQGLLVSDDIVITLLKDSLQKIGDKPFILDGFPRTYNQAIALNNMFNENNIENYIAIYLDIDEESAMKRALGRITCLKCGNTYNLYDDKLKPKQDNICDKCGSLLEKRSDDNEESFKKRFATFIENTKPIVKYYEDKYLLESVDVTMDTETIFKRIEEIIND